MSNDGNQGRGLAQRLGLRAVSIGAESCSLALEETTHVVNVLEALYVLTGLAILAALVQLARGRRESASRLGLVAAFGVIVCLVLYWYLKPTT